MKEDKVIKEEREGKREGGNEILASAYFYSYCK